MNLILGYLDNNKKQTLRRVLLFAITWTCAHAYIITVCSTVNMFVDLLCRKKKPSKLNAPERIIYLSDLIEIIMKL